MKMVDQSGNNSLLVTLHNAAKEYGPEYAAATISQFNREIKHLNKLRYRAMRAAVAAEDYQRRLYKYNY